jgi:hypothetical protein
MKLTIALSAAAIAAVAVVAGQPAANASVHFATPLAVTRYFAAAVDGNNMPELHQVTTPGSFRAVMAMRGGVRDVQARSCTATGRGDYRCVLSYQFRHQSGSGAWTVIVAPADDPGWYVYQYAYQGCGG